MAHTKLRQQEILQYKIDELTNKMSNFITFGLSSVKYNKLDILKNEVIAAKLIVDAS